MTIKEKIAYSSDISIFTLFKEGLFFKTYNEDAMLFVKHVRNYKVGCKYIKNVGSEVYSIGFPTSEIEKGKLHKETISEKIGASHYEEKDKHIIFYLKDKNLKSGYLEWQKTIPLHVKVEAVNEPIAPYKAQDSTIYNMIENYDLANNTPMQGLLFIQQLKEALAKINNHNGNI